MSSHDPYPWTPHDDDAHDLHAPTIAMPAVPAHEPDPDDPCEATVASNAADLQALLAGDRRVADSRSAPTEPVITAPQPTFDARRATPVAQVPGAHLVVAPAAAATPAAAVSDAECLAHAERGLRRYLWSGLALMVLPVFAIAMLFAGAPLGLMIVIEVGLQLGLLWGLWSYRGLPAQTGARRLATGAAVTTAAAVLPGLGAQIWAVVLFSSGTMSSVMMRAGLGLLVLLLLAPTMAFVGQMLLILSWRKVARWAGDVRALKRTRTLIVLGSLAFVFSMGVQLAINDGSFEGALLMALVTLLFGVLACVWWLLSLSAVRGAMRTAATAR